MTIEFQKRYWITKKQAKDLTKLASSMYDKDDPAVEINNPKPLLERLGIQKPLTMEQKLDRLFRGPRGIIQTMYEQGEETPEEMNDLQIEDDVEPVSPYEFKIMEEENLKKFSPVNKKSAPTGTPKGDQKTETPGPEGNNPPDAEKTPAEG